MAAAERKPVAAPPAAARPFAPAANADFTAGDRPVRSLSEDAAKALKI